MHDHRVTNRGIALMLAACAVFTLTDACSKLLAPHMPPTELMAVRGTFSAAMLLGFLRLRGEQAGLKHALDRRVLTRSIAEAISTLLYVTALGSLSLADASAIFQITPLLTLALAALVAGARVGGRRWLAVAAGFTGVMLVIKPGAGTFTLAALLPLGSAALVAFRDFVTGRIAAHVPTLVVTIVTILCGMTLGFLGSGFEDWRPLDGPVLALTAFAALTLVVGHFLAVAAFRGSDPAVVSPFRYATVPFAVLAGLILFGQVPDLVSLAGMALVVAAGVSVLHSRRAERRASLAPVAVPGRSGEA
ncbi:DMT family transporter [Ancylobacter lacus]|uniref:DMT family transporter n=1 Tax=Ancylobacter lacus TaxID=2579970 RepID=UPI001BD0FFB8|nr:DMT family transporter [Ancylobacter lacus]MBS7541296.1 DMT family transporter [Ancylobacter lacus]